MAGAAGGVVLVAGAVNAGKPTEQAAIQPAAAVIETSVTTTSATATVTSTLVLTSSLTQTVTGEPSTITVTVTETAAAAAPVEAPAVPAPAPLAAIPSTTKAPTTTEQAEPDSSGDDGVYENCTEASAAGAAPILQGEPGYADKLDRNHDGVACEDS